MFKDKSAKDSGSENSSLPSSNTPRKLSVRDVALGIGRRATNEEIEEYLNRPHGPAIPLDKAIKQIKRNLAKKRSQSKKWK